MTNLTPVIRTNRMDHEGHPYQTLVSARKATDGEFNAWFAEQLREFLFRHRAGVSTLTDTELLARTLRTFAR